MDKISDIIITVRLQIGRGYLKIMWAVSPQEGRKEGNLHFYGAPQNTINKPYTNNNNTLAEDINAVIGIITEDELIGPYGESTLKYNSILAECINILHV